MSEPDRTNNVEMIRLSPTVLQANGTEMANITVSIRAHRLETQSQTYSLVVTGVFDTEYQPIVYRDGALRGRLSFALLLCSFSCLFFLLFPLCFRPSFNSSYSQR